MGKGDMLSIFINDIDKDNKEKVKIFKQMNFV